MYEVDYEDISAIKDLADKYSISVLIIHHLRKAEAEDVMDTFSGTLGLTGAADGLLAMIRKSGRTELHITGRDIEECTFVLEFAPQIMSWNLLGKADELQSTQKRQRIVDAVSKHGPMSPTKISKITGLDIQYVKNTLPTLMSDGFIIKKERGVYNTVF